MATTPEGWVKKAVKELLGYRGVYYHMPVQNGMGKPTLDFICCVQGRFLAIEAKAPGKDLTPRQLRTKADIEEAGGPVLTVGGWGDFWSLWGWLAPANCCYGPDMIPAELGDPWERYFRNAGCKDVDKPTA